MSGGGIGSMLGTAGAEGAGMLLAPETMGASMLLPMALGAAGGALGGGVGSAATGGGNPWSSALLGGLTGLIGGGVGSYSGAFDAAAPAGMDAATGASAVPATAPGDATASMMANPDYVNPNADFAGAAGSTPSDVSYTAGTPQSGIAPSIGNGGSILQSGVNTPASDAANFMNPTSSAASSADAPNAVERFYANHAPELLGGNPTPAPTPTTIAGPNGSTIINMGNAGKSSSGFADYLAPIGLGLAGINALLGPQGSNPVNTSNLTAAQTAFNAPLPKYNYNSVSTPYTGSWYTYGQSPQKPMVQNTVTAAKRGGLIGYAHGGQVRALAMGGPPMQAPMGALPPSPMGAMPPPMPSQGMLPRPAGMPPASPGASPLQNPNPRQKAAQFAVGQRIGNAIRQHIQNQGRTPDGMVNGAGKGQDDAIPAKLSANEYIIPADTVSQLGDGSSTAGAKELDKMVHKVRVHKTSHKGGFPPKAHSPLAYIGRK